MDKDSTLPLASNIRGPHPHDATAKVAALGSDRSSSAGKELTSNTGVKIADDQNSLRAGKRGPTLLEDHFFREKMMHFDHERIPERVVHARGAGAHGHFQVYKSMAQHTSAAFLNDPAEKTPVFVRFSTVGGSRGSADTARDVRGFAVKFYTQAGNFDLVGNNMPVFFIQDAIKFPDFVHAVKPEPDREIPQASSAHDTLYDFVSLTPESTHMMLWLMSDRAIPRSYRMMEGFGVHTYRLVNAQGHSTYVKFHWKPLLGVHSLVWDEANKLAGRDPDFHRRDLWDAIQDGNFPEWELGVQMFDETQAAQFDFDVLDATKLIPEELVPVQRIGKMTLNRNVDNYFAETEQVAFCTSHIVPGIDFSDDPLLQGRNFSYLDTQLSRLGSPNFNDIPVNRPVCPFSNNQRDAKFRRQIDVGRVAYYPNSINKNDPHEASDKSGFHTFPETVSGEKLRVRPESFADHFTQATMFWKSQSKPEQDHIVDAFRFELAKVQIVEIRERMVGNLALVDTELAERVAEELGFTADARKGVDNGTVKGRVTPSQALSILRSPKPATIATRKIAILAADGANLADIENMGKVLKAQGATVAVLSPRLGSIRGSEGGSLTVDYTIKTMPSVVWDAVFVPGGAEHAKTLAVNGDAVLFVREAYKHAKPIAAFGDGLSVLEVAHIKASAAANAEALGVIVGNAGASSHQGAESFAKAIAHGRFLNRNDLDSVAA
jgi:catalase